MIRHAGKAVDQYAVAATVDTAAARVEADSTPATGGHAARRAGSRRCRPTGPGFEVMRACVDDASRTSAPGMGTIVTLDKRIDWD